MNGISAISGVNNIATSNNLLKTSNTESMKKESSFSDVIKSAIDKVNDMQVDSNNKVKSLIKGEDVSMHDVMVSAQEAQMSMQLMIEVRNKVYEVYQDLNRVQL
ncbi:flagellar hook-basal body complex protein FliE [Paraclostridium sordellii]|uniref:Flagellar hook-basal body complex protein FliE n=1 Tax=Paraclostridium sordellii TaxID=1505 RepID=A0A0C7E974_PARSO|nr:flagellar hook-basal body complex protein FliE [Paeniclostridium sordellii]QYE97283.1 flagellar hook-basal body complex protein FliE [Paeniclostridium sordellii]CEN21655.1 flagellar hook-basal body protein FliE [[Clostridium] sordellii] [Paeniclostridium sordellii]CEN79298.1 flagellar hook-basal body protein FliE [[Clostridium] sordellii] [Paeniclostridium sordellii]CEP81496.1 flagellar hook-basal body protein FliE [[Clostridium] sordellii] [Paeniclostridium sordellii]CEP88173.1 flagellar h